MNETIPIKLEDMAAGSRLTDGAASSAVASCHDVGLVRSSRWSLAKAAKKDGNSSTCEMNISEKSFYITGGAVEVGAPCYVERRADEDIYRCLLQDEFCYVLTSRQMGKSSLLARTACRLRLSEMDVVALDLMALGVNLTAEQWYDGLLIRIGYQLKLEDELEGYWKDHQRLGPLDRFFSAIREVVLPRRQRRLVIFVDEIDTVRSLPFTTDEFFTAIKDSSSRDFGRVTFCLLGVSTPLELIRVKRRSPFRFGRRIELCDFTSAEGAPLARRLTNDEALANSLFERILYWTNGHPYLTQRLCQAVAEERDGSILAEPPRWIDSLCENLFFSPSARDQDPNLVFVRESILKTDADLTSLMETYKKVHLGEPIPSDESNDSVNQLRLSGIVNAVDGFLQIRNRIYAEVFDQKWIDANTPDAVLNGSNGQPVRIKGGCTVGREVGNDLVLANLEVSRLHALIQSQQRCEFWLMDLGSRNGTFVNRHRIKRPTLLRDQDEIEIGPFRLVFHQSKTPSNLRDHQSRSEKTVPAVKRAWQSCRRSGSSLIA